MALATSRALVNSGDRRIHQGNPRFAQGSSQAAWRTSFGRIVHPAVTDPLHMGDRFHGETLWLPERSAPDEAGSHDLVVVGTHLVGLHTGSTSDPDGT